MRLFGKVDGTIDNIDRPFFLGDIFTLSYGELTVGGLVCEISVVPQLVARISHKAQLQPFKITIEAP